MKHTFDLFSASLLTYCISCTSDELSRFCQQSQKRNKLNLNSVKIIYLKVLPHQRHRFWLKKKWKMHCTNFFLILSNIPTRTHTIYIILLTPSAPVKPECQVSKQSEPDEGNWRSAALTNRITRENLAVRAVELMDSPSGSSSLGILSSLSAMRKASSRFCLLLLVLALDRSTRSGRRAYRMARKTTPLLQLALKSFTLNVQPALRKTHHCVNTGQS